MPWWAGKEGGGHRCCCGGGGWGGEAGKGYHRPGAPPGETRAFRAVWVAMACLTVPMLVFVSGVYKPPLAFIAGAYKGLVQQEEWPVDDAPAGHGRSLEERGRLHRSLPPAEASRSSKLQYYIYQFKFNTAR